MQVQFAAIRFDEGDKFRRIAGRNVCFRAFRCHNSSSISPDRADVRFNRHRPIAQNITVGPRSFGFRRSLIIIRSIVTASTGHLKYPRSDRTVLAFATV